MLNITLLKLILKLMENIQQFSNWIFINDQ